MKQIEKTIQSIKLLKVEKNYKPGSTPTFYYEIKLSGIKEELVVQTQYALESGLLNRKMSYELNEDNEVCNFIFQ